jgi:hypothetical protein
VQAIYRRQLYGIEQWSLRKIYREQFDLVLVVRLQGDQSVFDSILLGRDEYYRHPVAFSDTLPGLFDVLQTEADVVTRLSRCQPGKVPISCSAL